MYAIRSYYVVVIGSERIDQVEVVGLHLFDAMPGPVAVGHHRGELRLVITRIVITSYSIHYTKLYEGAQDAVPHDRLEILDLVHFRVGSQLLQRGFHIPVQLLTPRTAGAQNP